MITGAAASLGPRAPRASFGRNDDVGTATGRRLGRSRSLDGRLLLATSLVVVIGLAWPTRAHATCTYSVSPTAINLPTAFASPSFTVTTQPGCPWTATENASWITPTGGPSGTGTRAYTFNVLANAGPAARSATITVNDAVVTVNQLGTSPSCVDAVTPERISISGAASSQSFSVAARCAWQAKKDADASWIAPTGGWSGAANGTVRFTVRANPGPATRAGTIQVGDKVVTVVQSPACLTPPVVTPTTAAAPVAGGPVSFSITAPSGCPWTIEESLSWASFAGGTSGSGNGTVRLNVTANTGAARSGSVTVAGRTVSITQAPAPPCSFTFSPASVSFGKGAGTSTLRVNASGSTCAWSASESLGWLSIKSGKSGTGSGEVTISATANTAPNGRSGTLSIAGQLVPVTQAGTGSCNPSLSATSLEFPASEDVPLNRCIRLTVEAGCTWTVSESADWLSTIPSGSGSGSICFSASVNSGPRRTAAVTVAGKSLTVAQAAPDPCRSAPSLSATSLTLPRGGGSACLTVTAPSGCRWTSSEELPWASIQQGGSGTGTDTVCALAVANASGTARSGRMIVAGQDVTLTQQACGYTVSPATISAQSAGEAVPLTIATESSCPWQLTDLPPWIAVSGSPTGAGPGTATVVIAKAPHDRQATFRFGGQPIAVTQRPSHDVLPAILGVLSD